jgi:predicted amidohydrolase
VSAATTEATGFPTIAPSSATLRVALGEYDVGWEDPDGSLARADAVVARAAGAGARLVVLPEMCATGFTMDADAWAEPLDGASARRLGAIAAAHDVWVVAGLAARDRAFGAEGGAAFNAAAVFDPSGTLHAAYRKQRLFAFAGEHRAYEAGGGPLVVEIEGVRVSPFVCYDLRFPELFRAVARDVDLIVLIANWPAARRAHWDVLVRARAIENLCYVVAVNRTGEGGALAYDGGSVAYGPWGHLLAGAPGAGDALAYADVRPELVREVRARFPFLEGM